MWVSLFTVVEDMPRNVASSSRWRAVFYFLCALIAYCSFLKRLERQGKLEFIAQNIVRPILGSNRTAPPPVTKPQPRPCPFSPGWTFYYEIESVIKNKEKIYKYDRQIPMIFIGGMPRSGTTLMRAMLDAHPMVRCGEETRVVPRILQMVAQWRKSPKESVRLREAGLTADVIDAGVSAFILEVVARHGEPAPRLCNKDPFTLKSGAYLASMFPNSKFIFMIRDARATVHSIISRKVTITGFDLSSYRQCMQKWNQAVSTMHTQCVKHLGPRKCLPVHYEQLVLQPRQQMERILHFLELPWNESVLHHEEFVGKPGGISLSKVERSSDQVIRPLNLQALTSWFGHIPKDVEEDLAELAPMMATLGYDPADRRPTYGQPDPMVKDKTKEILEEAEEWKRKAEMLIKAKDAEYAGVKDDRANDIGQANQV